ncbi:Aminotransferase, class I/classII [Heracleum sosnowskyi]|uniref:Aminotransferase, class I/classII n=1 Tax=Heracleum sosnowskyi TaxID=360622 RepID=A0AAD8ITR2_9APIA|nr:Aminotransferase, class I/classII [Heracleum sosnowskyi]
MESRMQWAKKHENLIILRTFSKRSALSNPTYLETVKVALVQERERLLEKGTFFESISKLLKFHSLSGKDAKKLKEDLSKMGVMIRHYNNKELSCYVRVSVVAAGWGDYRKYTSDIQNFGIRILRVTCSSLDAQKKVKCI